MTISIYPDIDDGGACLSDVAKTRAVAGIERLPLVWHPADLDEPIATLAIIGMLWSARIPHLSARCGWTGHAVHGDRPLGKYMWNLANVSKNAIYFGGQQPMDFARTPPKFWAGQVDLETIYRSAMAAWFQIEKEAQKASSEAHGDPYAELPPIDARYYDGSFSATGYDPLNVADADSIGYRLRVVGGQVTGGRPLLELLAVFGAWGLYRLGCWERAQSPYIPVLKNIPLRHWYDLERALPMLSSMPVAVMMIGRRQVLHRASNG